MFDRYHRQILLPGIGDTGQAKLRDSHALIVGCGALGSVIIDSLARAGVGTLTIVDRDIVEITNLQRQILYDEADVTQGIPKAVAAKSKIAAINSDVTVHAYVDDFSHRNAAKFIEGADVILDGLDNFETRYLLNDLAVSRRLPFIYGGAVGTTGVSMAVLPRKDTSKLQSVETLNVDWNDAQSTPCLRCVFPEAPPPGASPTCDTAGVLGPVVMQIAAHQATQALKILTGNIDTVDRSLLSIDVWTNEHRSFDVSGLRDNVNCPCCGQRRFDYLQGDAASIAISLCGRNAVQITPSGAGGNSLDLVQLARSLSAHGRFEAGEHLLRGCFDRERDATGNAIELTLFPNGRAIIKGVASPEEAKSIYARFIGQ